MVSSGWLSSTSARLASTEAGRFFFRPVQLHLEPADLGVELGLQGLVVDRGGLTLVRLAEQVVGVLEHGLLPAVDQRGVDLELRGQLVDGLITLQRRQGDLRLELSRISLALTCHRYPLSWTAAQ